MGGGMGAGPGFAPPGGGPGAGGPPPSGGPMAPAMLPPIVQPNVAPQAAPAKPAAPGTFGTPAAPKLNLPPISGYAPANPTGQMAVPAGEVILSAKLTDNGGDITRGIVWRIFAQQPDAAGKLPLMATAQGGTSTFQLEPGTYVVHAAFGRAGATKRITVASKGSRETLVLDAGGLKLDAILAGGVKIPADKLRFSIYETTLDARGDRPLVVPNVKPGTVVRLSAGTYHVVSTYGAVNAVIRADIRVEAGKLTEAVVEHKAAQLTMKLVRDAGGEAIADTSWSILTDSGDIVRESVGAFASMVLAEGDYTIVATNRDRVYQRQFAVVGGRNQDVEVLAREGQPADAVGSGDGMGEEVVGSGEGVAGRK